MKSDSELRKTILDVIRDMEKVVGQGTAAWRQLLLRVSVVPLRRALELPVSTSQADASHPWNMFAADTWWPKYRSYVVCPHCESDNCHLEHVSSAECGRGSTVAIDFWCESGHRFSLSFQFHKGNTYAVVSRNTDYDVENDVVLDECKTPLAEMWRD